MRQPGKISGHWLVIPGRKTPPVRGVPDGPGEPRWRPAEVRNGLPTGAYQYRAGDQAATIERVCRWRRSLIAAVLVLELAAEQAGEQQ